MTARRSFAWVALLLIAGSSLQAQEIAWRKEYGTARQEAADKGRPLILTFTSQNCRWCVALDSTTYRDPTVTKMVAERFVPLKVEAEIYPNLVTALGIQGFPTVVVASASGRIVEVHRGYIEAAPFADLLNRALTKLPSETPAKTDVASKPTPAKPTTTEKKEAVVVKENPKPTPATTTSVTKEPTSVAKEVPPVVKETAPKENPTASKETPPTAVASQKDTPPMAVVAQKDTSPLPPVPGQKTETPAPDKKEAVVKQPASPPEQSDVPIPPPALNPPTAPTTVVKSDNETAVPVPPSAITPPVAVPKAPTEPVWMADDFRRAAEAVGRSEFPKAVQLLKNLIKDDIQWPSQARAAGLMREIERQASTRLSRIKESEGKGEITEAIRLAQEVVSRYDGTEAASEALSMVSTLSARLEDKDRDRMMQAQAVMKQAEEDFKAGQWLPCLLRCEDLQARFSDLPESVKAGDIIAKIKSNPSSLQRICDGLPEVAGQVYLTMAEVKIKQGEPQQAMFFLERVLQAFPSSKHAEMAQVRLSQIQGPPPVGAMEDHKD